MTEKVMRYCDMPNCDNGPDGSAMIQDDKELWVDAGAYGAHFHLECVTQATGLEMLKALSLDDIKLVKVDGEYVKLIYVKDI